MIAKVLYIDGLVEEIEFEGSREELPGVIATVETAYANSKNAYIMLPIANDGGVHIIRLSETKRITFEWEGAKGNA